MFTRLSYRYKLVFNLGKKTYCTKTELEKTVRVRFAPSPTGYMHLGGLRTALYNYVFARSKNGKFILRLEDTDANRVIPGAAEQLEKDLEWAGIPPDESPKRGGPVGPYTQSQRIHLYQEHIKNLLRSEAAYRCFCSEQHLALRRKEILRMQGIPKYDNRCRGISKDESEKRAAAGEPHTIRFKLAEGSLTFNDIVYGSITIELASREGDFVIVKSDGMPTYHLASVLDDHMMGITHVLRGVEWQVSTPKHLQIYRALNWKPPEFAHLPLLVNADGSKLSKRQADLHMGNFRTGGILPEVLLSFVSDMGGGFKRDQDKLKVHQLPELVSQFDLSAVGITPARVDTVRLDKLNHSALQERLLDPQCRKQLAFYTQELLMQHFKERMRPDSYQMTIAYIENILMYAAPRISRLSSLFIPEHEFLWFPPDAESLIKLFPQCGHAADILAASIPILRRVCSANDRDVLRSMKAPFTEFSEKEGFKYPLVMSTIRVCITGSQNSPSVGETIELLGLEEALKRLDFALQVLKDAQEEKEKVNRAA